MNLIELFSGSGSLGTVARSPSSNVVSLDMKTKDVHTEMLISGDKRVGKTPFLYYHPLVPNTAKRNYRKQKH